MDGKSPGQRRLRALRPFATVRWRLTLWYVMILALILAVFSGLIYQAQASSLRAAQDDQLRQQAHQLATLIDPSSAQLLPEGKPAEPVSGKPSATESTESPSDLEQEKRLLAASPVALTPPGRQAVTTAAGPGAIVLLIDGEGRINIQVEGIGTVDPAQVFSTENLKRLLVIGAPAGPPRASDSLFSMIASPSAGKAGKQAPFRFYATSILVKNLVFGTLVLGEPDRAAAQLHRLLLTLLLAAPFTLLVATAGGYWLAARAMRPVRRIAATVREIGGSDLSRRVQLVSADELGELAATFDQMLDRLEAAFRLQRQFTSDASHELRTPLTIVRLELARALATDLPLEAARALDVVQSENDYMARLVDELLLLVRADAGRLELRRDELDLGDIALGIIERLAPLARERGVRLIGGEMPELLVAGERAYLARALTNLVENGIKYTAGSGSWVRVEAGACEDGLRAWVRVSDDGPGIAPEHLPHLFERFYRVDTARARAALAGDCAREGSTGSGLGLAIVEWLVRAHGGQVRASSRPGEGSTFEVRLPLLPSAASGRPRGGDAEAAAEA